VATVEVLTAGLLKNQSFWDVTPFDFILLTQRRIDITLSSRSNSPRSII